MPTFTIECADRNTARPYSITIETLDRTAAMEWAVSQGHLVGRIDREEPAPDGPTVVALDRRTINSLQWRMLAAMVAALLIFTGVSIVLGFAGLAAYMDRVEQQRIQRMLQRP